MEEQLKLSRSERAHQRGLDMFSAGPEPKPTLYGVSPSYDYSKIKVGVKTLEDATFKLGSYQNDLRDRRYSQKSYVLKMLADNNLSELRNISNFYYNVNGIYQKACNYLAFLYRYDWYMMPELWEKKKYNKEDLIKDYKNALKFFDNTNIKKLLGDIALEVVKNGAYYGYISEADLEKGLVLQPLPVDYCRSRFKVGNRPVVEFNMAYFVKEFPNEEIRNKILKVFPPEFEKGYKLYRQSKLVDDINQHNGIALSSGWYMLDVDKTIKFNFFDNDLPIFINSIPLILDLDAAQGLDRQKQMQSLLKILVQKVPLDKNNDLIFDMDEIRDIHSNGVNMLKRAVGMDVFTTFTDVECIDVSDNNTATTKDDLEKVERAVFNSMGISQNLFNADGNLSLNNSVLNDESSVRNLLQQFEYFLNQIAKTLSTKPRQFSFRLYLLETTQYNYKDLAKIYKEQTQIGNSKILPALALGHSQSFILNSAHFENDVLNLVEVMIPPAMSSTMSGSDVLAARSNRQTEEKQAGRTELPDEQKSEKTIMNRESMS